MRSTLRSLALPALALAPACQEPFAEDRHDLTTFRIAGVAARSLPDERVELRAFVYSGHGLYHPTAPELTWTVGEQTLTGPRVEVDAAWPLTAELLAVGDGEERAVLELSGPPTPPTVAAWTRGATALTLDDVLLPIEERLAVEVGADAPVAAGGGLRLALDVLDDGDRLAHWMGTGGQFAELDATTTDWFAGTAEIDDEEIVSTSPAAAGVYPLVALVYDGEGGNTWTYLDAAVDSPGPLLRVGGRLFPVDTALTGEGWWEATVEADESLAGIRLVDLTPGADPAGSAEGWCGRAAGEPFDPADLAEGACARDALVGARVVVWGVLP